MNHYTMGSFYSMSNFDGLLGIKLLPYIVLSDYSLSIFDRIITWCQITSYSTVVIC